MRKYELTIVVKPDLDATSLAALLEKVKGFIAADGGAIVKTDAWGMRRLGYPISRYHEGNYYHMLIDLDAGAVSRLENRVKLTEDVLRHLLVVAENYSTAPAQPAEVAAPAESAEPPADSAPVDEAAATPA